MKKSLLLLLMLVGMLTMYSFTTAGDGKWIKNKQSHLVTGRVTACDGGAEIPGATVIIYGTTVGTTTDSGGYFSIIVPNNASLIFSFIGMRSVLVSVGNLTQINVCLQDEFE